MTADPLWLWGGFTLFVLAMMALDLGVFHRKSHVVGFREALTWTGVWVTLALIFNAGVWYFAGPQKALEFFTGYLIEYSLSADNVFIFALIFSYFAVPPKWQHKVLFWGILGALVMRVIMIFAGVALISRFHWILYFFGAFLIFTGLEDGLRQGRGSASRAQPDRPLVSAVGAGDQRDHEDQFFVRKDGRLMATPLWSCSSAWK